MTQSTAEMPAAVPRRSVLFMPGSNRRAMEKASSLQVDSVILDLEDSVLPAAKDAARSAVVDAMAELDFGYREVLIRINALDTPWWQDDLRAAMQTDARGIVMPKVESADQVHTLIQAMQQICAARKSLWPMLETPAGILAAAAICSADQLITAVLVGTADLAKELDLPERRDRQGLMPALGQVVLAAKAAKISVIDGVYMNIHNQQELEEECGQGEAMGFDGKSLIHPAQLDVTNRVFSPTQIQIEQAQQLLAAWQCSSAGGAGVCVVNDRLVEHLHVERANKILAIAEQIKKRCARSGDNIDLY